jgi:hypothetical protein
VQEKRPFQFKLSAAIVLTLIAGALLGLYITVLKSFRPYDHRSYYTISTLKHIEYACEIYKLDWGEFPPDVAPSGQRSSAALIYYLTHSFQKIPKKAGELWATQDVGPYLDLNPAALGTDASGQPIIVDRWGHPFEYDNIRDDKSTPDGFTKCGPDDIRIKPQNLKSFDLFSHGDPDKNEPITNFDSSK